MWIKRILCYEPRPSVKKSSVAPLLASSWHYAFFKLFIYQFPLNDLARCDGNLNLSLFSPITRTPPDVAAAAVYMMEWWLPYWGDDDSRNI